MSDALLNVYHCLPKWMRSGAASLHGLHLRSWRFGPETPRLVRELLEREHWDSAQWHRWQQERLAYVLHRAATRVPYYREQWAERRRRGDTASWEYLENWPVLDKEAARTQPRTFVADDCDTRRMFYAHTSGTTGTPVDLWRSRSTMRALYAFSLARTKGWHGIEKHDRWAKLGGQVVTLSSQRQPPFWVWNAALNQLYMSTYHLAPDLITHYLDALVQYRITYLFGYTSSMFALAQEMLRLNRRDIKLKVVITEAEPLFEHHRRVIAEAFQCPVRETYGMGEIVTAANECPSGTLHQWPEIGLVETLENNLPVGKGEFGEFVCTSLLNSDMPLIRYRVGDRGRVTVDQSCKCGRTLPAVAVVEAGSYDLLITPDGRRVFGLEDVFFRTPIRQAQIVQEKLNLIRARYVPAPEFTPESARSIVKAVKARMEGVEVILEPVAEIPRAANGKFWVQVCNVPAAEIESALNGSRDAAGRRNAQ
ncbi:MAG: phenylacetate--CoA ligase family protein [Pyrinomonadaceae bacterium]